MAESKRKQAWSIASSIMAMIANTFRDPDRTEALSPNDFNPCVKKKETVLEGADLQILRAVFCRKK